MVMPNQPSPLEQRLKEWDTKARQYSGLAQLNIQTVANLRKGIQDIMQPVTPSGLLLPPRRLSSPAISTDTTTPEHLSMQMPALELPPTARYSRMRLDLQAAESAMVKYDYYTRLYNQAPILLASGRTDVLSLMQQPDDLTDDERSAIQQDVDGMKAALEGRAAPLPNMAKDVTQPDLPELKPPTSVSSITPISVHSLTQDSIRAALVTPTKPDPILTQQEWQQHLYQSGQVQDIGDSLTLNQQADSIIKEWQDRDSQIAAFKAGTADMPEWKTADLLREAIFQPGLMIADAVGWYSERVSQPLAGAIYSWMVPDMNSAYQKYSKSESEWLALGHAFRDWDSNWFLKYMVMEASADPLSYAGWGIATTLTKPIPYLGRLVGAAERGLMDVMDIPFDAIKFGLAKLPTTAGIRALQAQHIAGQYVEKAITKLTNKSYGKLTMKDWDAFSKAAIKYVQEPNHALLENDMSQAGRELLKHTPYSRQQIQEWLPKLKSTLMDVDITKQTVDNVNNLFEDFFTMRKLTSQEAGVKLAGMLDGKVDDAVGVAQKLFESRAKFIEKQAMKFTHAETPYKALQKLMDRNFKVHTAIEESEAFLARREMGRVHGLLTDIPTEVTRVWSNYIDKILVAPLARAYLVFGLYGPMNILEDAIRSTLGGVLPRFNGRGAFERQTVGLSVDPMLVQSYGISEVYGILREGERSSWNNWPLQLFTLGQKKWSEKLYGALVKLPGAYSMDMRRGFILGKYKQELARLGGEQVEQLAKAGPQHIKLASRSLSKMIQREVENAKLTGSADVVRELKGVFTRKNINRMEVVNILNKHPDLPNEVRSYLVKAYDNDLLMKDAAASIDQHISVAGDMLLDDFIHSPELASSQFEAMSRMLTEIQVGSAEELAQVLLNVNMMSEMYGATSKQILSMASRRSRGLPFDKRNAMMNRALDDIASFKDRAGKAMDDVIENLKGQMQGGKLVTPEYAQQVSSMFDLQVAKRLKLSSLHDDMNNWRHDYFSGASKQDLKSPEFWDDFYLELDQHLHDINVESAGYDSMISNMAEEADRIGGIVKPPRPTVAVQGAISTDDIARLLQVRVNDISSTILQSMVVQNDKDMFVAYVMGKVRPQDTGWTKEGVAQAYDNLVQGLGIDPKNMSWLTGKQLELKATRDEFHDLLNAKTLPQQEVDAINKYVEDSAKAVQQVGTTTGFDKAGYDSLRQQAMDSAHKWYYKEYVDYTHANAFDAVMKAIYPYWSYESQRWFWLPRSFLRHPGTLTEFGRFQNNTDSGYVHVPTTSIDYNPFRGTIYGTLTSRLTKQDYPEYYDSLPAGNLVSFSDSLSRYGFYPGAHFTIPLALMGGQEAQFGEVLPAMFSSTLDSAIALWPKNEFIKAISKSLFNDRFRDYMTMREVSNRGGNGSLLFAKLQQKEKLTDEEQNLWDESRGTISAYSALFEQTGALRLRPQEQVQMYENASKAIQEMTGYTPQQQDWLRKHGKNIWDMVGGMSPTEQETLKALGYYQYAGSTRALLPSKQQDILNKVELAWDQVRQFSDSQQQAKLALQSDLLSGKVSPSDYNDQLVGLGIKQREYIDQKVKEYPLMDIDNRKDYMLQYGIANPVLHPMKELLNLFFSVELYDIIDPETGEKMQDWDRFWAERDAIEMAVPPEYKGEWTSYLSKNSTRIEDLRRKVYSTYFRKYNSIYTTVLAKYGQDEQRIINEYLYLKKMGQNLQRQEQIKQIATKDGRQLVSAFQSDVGEARRALRYENPSLDAWLSYWGKTSSFLTPQAEGIFQQIKQQTGRVV